MLKNSNEAVDRVMRGEGAPSPIYRVRTVLLQILDEALYKVPLQKIEKKLYLKLTKNILLNINLKH